MGPPEKARGLSEIARLIEKTKAGLKKPGWRRCCPILSVWPERSSEQGTIIFRSTLSDRKSNKTRIPSVIEESIQTQFSRHRKSLIKGQKADHNRMIGPKERAPVGSFMSDCDDRRLPLLESSAAFCAYYVRVDPFLYCSYHWH
jgi:hypothetical protein